MGETDREVWIGLAQVSPKPGNAIFDGAPGAFSNVLCLVRDETEFRSMVEETFGGLGFKVREITDIEPLEQRRRYGVADDEILHLANGLSDSSPLLYDTFYVYESEFE